MIKVYSDGMSYSMMALPISAAANYMSKQVRYCSGNLFEGLTVDSNASQATRLSVGLCLSNVGGLLHKLVSIRGADALRLARDVSVVV